MPIRQFTQDKTEKMSVSETIRKRIKSSGKRFFACDNVSEFIEEGEKEELILELSEKFDAVLDALLIDRENDPNSKETGHRLAKMYIREIMAGRYEPEPKVTAFPNEDQDAYHGMLVIRAEIRSVCSHHHQTVNGTAYIGIIPNGHVLGLSKYIRLAQWASRRGTLQEELCGRIKNLIVEKTGTDNCAVYIEARHGCCEQRGVMAHNSLTQTTVLGGAFNDQKTREEFFNQISLQKQA